MEAEEGVDLLLQRQCRDKGVVGVLRLDLGQKKLRPLVVGLPVESELQIILDVVVAGVDQGLVREPCELAGEGLVELGGVAAQNGSCRHRR